MRLGIFQILSVALITLSSLGISRADIKITIRTTVSGYTIEETTYIKGPRERDERANMTTLYECDLKRLLNINDKSKKYFVMMLDESGSPVMDPTPSTGQPADTRRGGIVNYTINVTDTGERRDMFGFKARHLKTSMTMDSSPDACEQQKMRIETDGWYIPLQYGMACSSDRPQAQRRPQASGCQDQVRYKHSGPANTGFELSGTTTMYGPDGQVMNSVSREVITLTTANLDSKLFEPPAGYTEVKSMQEMYGAPSSAEMAAAMSGSKQMASQQMASEEMSSDSGNVGTSSRASAKKAAGTIRIGVVAFNNKTDHTLSDSLRDNLVNSLTGSNVDAVALTGDIEADARQKDCDYMLFTDISSLKQSAARKIGGMFGRVASVGSGGIDKTEAKLDFKVVPIAGGSPILQSSATAKEEGDDASIVAALTKEAQSVMSAARKKR